MVGLNVADHAVCYFGLTTAFTLILAHIYVGTIGMEGAIEAMAEGTVNLNWAKQHHSLWLEEQMARTSAKETGGQAAATPAE